MGTITMNILESYSKKFETDKNNRVAMRTVITNGLNKSAINVDPKEKGKEGYYIMSDRWFDEYIFQVVVNKKYLSDSLKELLDGKVTELEPWDPMGSLAQVVK